MDVLDSQLGTLDAVLEARLARMHDAYVVEVDPERGSGREVCGGDQFDEVVLR